MRIHINRTLHDVLFLVQYTILSIRFKTYNLANLFSLMSVDLAILIRKFTTAYAINGKGDEK